MRPILGGMVCHKHGGSAPQVKAAAMQRIAAFVDPALDQLGKLLRGKKTPPAVLLAAIKDILDRAGHKADIGHIDGDFVLKWKEKTDHARD